MEYNTKQLEQELNNVKSMKTKLGNCLLFFGLVSTVLYLGVKPLTFGNMRKNIIYCSYKKYFRYILDKYPFSVILRHFQNVSPSRLARSGNRFHKKTRTLLLTKSHKSVCVSSS